MFSVEIILGYIGYGLDSFGQFVANLPWPTADDWFRWFIFLVLGKVVWYGISRYVSRRRGSVPANLDSHSTAATVSSLFDHH